MKFKLYKRVLSWMMVAAMLLSWVKLPARAVPADEAVTLELTGYAGFGTSTSTGKHFAFSTAADSKTALAATSWFAGASPSTQYGSYTTLTGKILVDGVEEDATIRFNGSGSALYIEKSQTYLEEGKEIVLPKENVFTVTKSNGGTIVSGAQLQFAQTYVLTYDTTTLKPVLTQRFFVELADYAGYGTTTSTGKHFAFSTSADTKTALATTGWFAGASPSTQYGSFTTLTGKILVDGVEEDATLRFNASGSALYIEKSQTYLEAGKTVVIPKANVFTITKSNGGTINSKEMVQFVDTYKLTYDTTTQKPVLEVVVEIAAKEKVTVELSAYAWMSNSGVENGYGFSMTADTKTALNATSWFGNTSNGGYGEWTRATGKVLVDGVETEINIVFQASQSAVYIASTVAYLTAGKTVVIPKDNVFTVNRTYGGTLDNGGQIQFAENYKLTYDTATQKPILSVEVDAKEKVTVELSAYAWMSNSSVENGYGFSMTADTKTALNATSWFGNTSNGGYGEWTRATGKVLVDGVETEINIVFQASQSAVYIASTVAYLTAGKTVVIPKDNVFTVNRTYGGTLDNGGQIQFAKSYKLTYDATTQKPVLGLDPADCTHVWDAATGTCTLCKTSCEHTNVTNNRCDTCGYTVYTVQNMQIAFNQVDSGNNWIVTFSTDPMPAQKAYLKAAAIVDGEAKTVWLHYATVGGTSLVIYPQCFSGGVVPTESLKLVKDTILEAWTAPNGTKLQDVPTYRISEDLEVKKTNGVWLDTSKPLQDLQVGFNSVDSNNNWYFKFDTDPMPAQKAYLKGTAVVDGEVKTVWLHYATVGEATFVAYHQTFSGGVVPAESLKLVKDTILEAWTAPNGTKLQDVPTYRISENLEVKMTSGVWLDSNTQIESIQIFFDKVDANTNYWYFTATGESLPEKSMYLQGQALVDGVVQKVFIHYTGPNGVYIYSQCFTKGVPTESFQLLPGTLLIPYTTPNSGRIPGATVLMVTNETTANKAEGILWVGTSDNRTEPELVDPLHATVEYAGTTQNMLWLRVTTDEGKKLKEVYGDRMVLKGKMLVGLLNDEGSFTEYMLENVTYQVLEGSLYVSMPGLNALEKVYISAGTVLTPSSSAASDRSIVIENEFHLERNEKDKWELRSKAVDNPQTNLPQTGDSFDPAILISVMIVSFVGMTVTLVFYRKKKNSF